MKFSFGIITSGSFDHFLERIIFSIQKQIPNDSYEIIIVGNTKIKSKNTLVIPFNENIKPNWITKKKNIISENSKFDNIVYLHDYICLEDGWYKGWLEFGDCWDISMNQMLNLNGERFIDWMGMPDDACYGNVLLPYEYSGSSGMYIPGNYFLVKKDVVKKFPFNEEFVWGEGEDIEWSKRLIGGFFPTWLKNREKLIKENITHNFKYIMNKKSKVLFLKEKYMHPNFKSKYDMHSGNEARPLPSTPENYEFLKYRL